MKKWEKIINKAFEQKIRNESEGIAEKLLEKFQTEQEIKNIINEFYIKKKNCDYFVKRQWSTLKKFNLLEKIAKEERKIINQNEKQKLSEIKKEAIEKLAACHMTGFEPLNIIRKKILSKIQKKYSISEVNMKELEKRFIGTEEDDANLNNQREELQLEALDNITNNTGLFSYKEVDKNTYLTVKGEIKKYEKDLELKATQNEIVEKNISLNNEIGNNEINLEILNTKINNEQFESDNDMLIDEDEIKFKISDCVAMKLNNEKLGEMKKEAKEEWDVKMENCNEKGGGDNKEYKSEILNNFSWKVKTFGKLSDFDLQILLYIFHSVTNELILAKNSKKEYNCDISPIELMKFLEEFKIDPSAISEQPNSPSLKNTGCINNINNNEPQEHNMIDK